MMPRPGGWASPKAIIPNVSKVKIYLMCCEMLGFLSWATESRLLAHGWVRGQLREFPETSSKWLKFQVLNLSTHCLKQMVSLLLSSKQPLAAWASLACALQGGPAISRAHLSWSGSPWFCAHLPPPSFCSPIHLRSPSFLSQSALCLDILSLEGGGPDYPPVFSPTGCASSPAR